jgi:hypothetical protein
MFTRVVMGESGGGEGDSGTGFADDWDPAIAGEYVTTWIQRGLMTGAMVDAEDLVDSVAAVLAAGPSVALGSVSILARPR